MQIFIFFHTVNLISPMKKLKPFIFLFSLISLLNSCKQDNKIPSDGGSDNSSLANKMEVIPNQFILVFKNDFILPTSLKINKANTRAEIALINEGYRIENIFKIDELLLSYGIDPSSVIDYYTDAISGVSLRVTEEKLRAIRNDKNVSFVEQDKTITLPNDVVESVDGGDLRAQTTPCGITNAGGSADGSASTKWIWIVDTGIDLTHPDLNVETNKAYAKSFVGGSANDCNGHGTHCAGIAAAKNNTIGVVGVSAGARVVPVRVLNCQGSGQTSGIISGLNHVASKDEPGDVVNMSLGGYWGSNCATGSSYVTAITNLGIAGTRVCLAGGNSADNAALYTPACINGLNVYTIAAMDCAKAWASYSNYGIPPTDWIATGSGVYSTYKNGGYATLSGTSMATPHVAGIVHSIQADPLQNGSVLKNGVTYKIAVRQ